MYILMIVIFVLGYAAIALEHPIKVDKAASALLTGVLCWTVLVFGSFEIFGVDSSLSISEILNSAGELPVKLREYFTEFALDKPEKAGDVANTAGEMSHFITHELEHHVIEIGSILFFLLGAMTIVELIDAHEGFRVITDRITTTKKVPLLWTLSILTFFFSAALDNLTTSIVMAALLKKLIKDRNDLWTFAGVIIIAANAGGAWSPIGDVTTIMLWIGGQITASNVIIQVFLPSLICMIVPLIIMTFTLKGNITRPDVLDEEKHAAETTAGERNAVFALGVSCLLFVPVFKTVTHLPPFMGILFGLGVMWLVTEIMHGGKEPKDKTGLSVHAVLSRVDVPSVLFFLGILIAVGSLQSAGHLVALARGLQDTIGDIYVINVIIGLLSSIVDNVPLVAGAMGMYEIGPEVAGVAYPTDHNFWQFLAYCAGTGGSCLIIGSAAGVAIMGILRIDFIWYLKRISLLALIGYLAGAGVYYLINV